MPTGSSKRRLREEEEEEEEKRYSPSPSEQPGNDMTRKRHSEDGLDTVDEQVNEEINNNVQNEVKEGFGDENDGFSEGLKPNDKRLIITHLELENFKSYGGVRKIGPFHKVGDLGLNFEIQSNLNLELFCCCRT